MGRASRSKRMDRPEIREKVARRSAPSAASGASQAYIYGVALGSHQAVVNIMADDEPQGLMELEFGGFNNHGLTLLDLQYMVRGIDGESFSASIHWQAYGQRASRCLAWLVRHGMKRRHPATLEFVSKFLIEFSLAPNTRESWPWMRGASRDIFAAFAERGDFDAVMLPAMKQVGGVVAELAQDVSDEFNAMDEADDIDSSISHGNRQSERRTSL